MDTNKPRVCARCLYSERHPLNLIINEAGLCSGCVVHEEKYQIDWTERLLELRGLVQKYKSKTGDAYDCIVPVSAARDSYFIVYFVKNVLKLNPLLVTYNPHYNTALGLRNLAFLRTLSDSDIFTQTVSPQKVKNITRATLRRIGSVYWHVIAGQTVFPVQTAVKLKIPLIIWGCHQGMDQVGMFSHDDRVEMTRKYRHEHDLMGLEAQDLLDDEDHVFEADIYPYLYPDANDIAKVGVKGIYLNNYVFWDSKKQHELMIDLYNYETQPQISTFDSYNDVDSFIYNGLHDQIKKLKWGYTKVTDHACREIRLGRLTREQAQALVNSYENTANNDSEKFLAWLGMNQSSMRFILDQHRNPQIWQRDSEWNWQRVDKCIEPDQSLIDQNRLPLKDGCEFIETAKKVAAEKCDQFQLFSKGWVHQ